MPVVNSDSASFDSGGQRPQQIAAREHVLRLEQRLQPEALGQVHAGNDEGEGFSGRPEIRVVAR